MPDVIVPFRVADLTKTPPADRDRQALAIAHHEFGQPFDLTVGPPLRATLIRLAPRDHLLVLVMHHIVTDAWSFGIIGRELGALYNLGGNDQVAGLPELALQYGDYARWMAGRAAAAPWWRPIMADEPGVLDLPTDRARPRIPSHRGQFLQRMMPSSMTAVLRQHCSRSGMTLFSALLAGLEVFLMYYTGSRRFAIGTMTAGRNEPDVHDLVGLFANMTVIPVDLRDAPSFTELGLRIQAQVAIAVDQASVPFSELVAALNRRDDLTRIPLLQVRYQHREVGEETWCFNGLSIEVGELDSGLTKSDLALFSADYGDQLMLMLGYAGDLFDTSTAHRILADCECLLELMLASPEVPVDRVCGLPAPPGSLGSSEIAAKGDSRGGSA
jgi:Condensation domain